MISTDQQESDCSLILEGIDQPDFAVRRVYLLERDHRTNSIRFMTHMPTDLKSFLSEEEFGLVVGEINELCQEACKPCKWENFIDVVTLFLFYYFYRNHFYRTVERLKVKVRELNEKYLCRGILIRCPSACAFMHLEIDVGSVQSESGQEAE